MAIITVLDANGAPVGLERPLSPGRAAGIASRPVVLSLEDAAAQQAIQVQPLSTLQIPASSTSTAAVLRVSPEGSQIRIANTGLQPCRIEFGHSDVVARQPAPGALSGGFYANPTLGSVLIPAGSIEVVTAVGGTTHVAVRCDGGTTTMEFTIVAGV